MDFGRLWKHNNNFIGACKEPMIVGPCRGYSERWFFDGERGLCEPFGYTGCGGNANNFYSRDTCMHACYQHNDSAPIATATTHVETSTSTKKLKFMPSSADNEVIMNDTPNSQDFKMFADGTCEMGPWMGWSDCFGECDFAVKLNYRLIVNNTMGLGKSCHKLVKSRSCKPGHCRRLFMANSSDVSSINNALEDRSQNALFH